MSISVRGLSKRYRVPIREPGVRGVLRHLFAPQYRTVLALDDISFTIEAGEAVGYLGPNGAGKTTTMKILSGILHPDEGEVHVLGWQPWEHRNAFKKAIGFVMGQKGQLWWDLPAADSFELLQEIYEVPKARARATVEALVERFAVGDLLRVPLRNLSLGERMKMELIAVLLHEPQVLFLDEPTIGLDVLAQHEIRAVLKEYRRERGITLILASHYMRDVEDLCNRIILLDEGRILFDGSPDAIVRRHMPCKEVVFTLEAPVDRQVWAAWGKVRRVDAEHHRITLTVRQEEVARVIQMAAARYAIAEVQVREPTLEDVIRLIFSSEGEDSTYVCA